MEDHRWVDDQEQDPRVNGELEEWAPRIMSKSFWREATVSEAKKSRREAGTSVERNELSCVAVHNQPDTSLCARAKERNGR